MIIHDGAPRSLTQDDLDAEIQEMGAAVIEHNGDEMGFARSNMPAPFTAGGAIWKGSVRCSLNIPITRANGTMGVLTGGHCGVGEWRTLEDNPNTEDIKEGLLVGSTALTTWPTSTPLYGDWQILQRGTSYANRIYTGIDPWSKTTAPIVGVRTVNPLLKSQYCSSGSTTGQVCRYFVVGLDVERTYPIEPNSATGIGVSHLIDLQHSNDQVYGKWDTQGWAGGDSGGPIYQHHTNPTGVIPAGLVSGQSVNPTTKAPTGHYYATSYKDVVAKEGFTIKLAGYSPSMG